VQKCTRLAGDAGTQCRLDQDREEIMVARILMVTLLAVGSAHAQVYRWTDKNGTVHSGDNPSTAGVTVPTTVTGAPGTKRTAAPAASASQPQKPPQTKTVLQQEAESQARQAAPR
jgi:hypothetical protein